MKFSIIINSGDAALACVGERLVYECTSLRRAVLEGAAAVVVVGVGVCMRVLV